MKIFLGADHRGFDFKERLKEYLSGRFEVEDCGVLVPDPEDDYPPVAFAVAEKTVAEPGARGILLCGSGVGVSIAANKVCGARAVLAHTRGQAALARAHDDVNILCLRADDAILADLHATVDAFLRTPFDARERRVRRLRQIATYEKSNYCPDE